MAAPFTRPRTWLKGRVLSFWSFPGVDEAPAGPGGSFVFEQADLVLLWQRLRAVLLLVVMGAALGLAVDGQPAGLRFLLVGGLSAVLFVNAVVRIRRREANPLPVLLADAAAIGIGLGLLQIDAHALVAPFLYATLSAAIVLPWRRALAMWCYQASIAAAVVATAGPLTHWLGAAPVGPRAEVAVWVTTGVFGVLCLAETLVLTGAIRRFALARQARLAYQSTYQSRRKDEFLAGVSHALRTPLTCVVGFGQLIEKDWADQLPGPVGVMLGELNQQADVMAAMVDNLVIRAQDQAGDLTLNPEVIDLRGIAAGVIRTVAWLYPDKQIRLAGGPPVATWADPTRTRQIVRNLLSNAVQHGGDHIDVSTSDGVAAVFAVTDDGAGPVTCGGGLHIQPFEKTTAAIGAPSLGLGLPTSLRLAQLMGGDLTHQHTPGVSTFTLTLPPGAPSDGPARDLAMAASPR
jgi:signal transduction histidine kinase